MESASNSGTRVGYTRVSTVAQTLDQQNTALAAAGVTKTFSDTMSGARDDRPGLAALMDYVREGDTVVVWTLDRLGRSTLHILETVKALADAGVTLIATTDGIDSSTAAGRKVIGVLAASVPQVDPLMAGEVRRRAPPAANHRAAHVRRSGRTYPSGSRNRRARDQSAHAGLPQRLQHHQRRPGQP